MISFDSASTTTSPKLYSLLLVFILSVLFSLKIDGRKSGYDTRPYRFRWLLEPKNVQVFEIDLKVTQDRKKQILAQNRLVTDDSSSWNVRFVPCNFSSTVDMSTLFSRLEAQGYTSSKRHFL